MAVTLVAKPTRDLFGHRGHFVTHAEVDRQADRQVSARPHTAGRGPGLQQHLTRTPSRRVLASQRERSKATTWRLLGWPRNNERRGVGLGRYQLRSARPCGSMVPWLRPQRREAVARGLNLEHELMLPAGSGALVNSSSRRAHSASAHTTCISCTYRSVRTRHVGLAKSARSRVGSESRYPRRCNGTRQVHCEKARHATWLVQVCCMA